MIELPNPFSGIPLHRLSYSHPSPIHYLPGLTKHINNVSMDQRSAVRLWTKREDQAGPLACYGNKYRKFEYIIPDILKSKATTLVTEGALQSNHTVQVAGMARILGLKCSVLLHRGIGGARAAIDKEAYMRVGNVQINKLLGADAHFTDETDTGDERGPLLPFLDELRAQGESPYWIPSGASLHPLGGLGYARCAFEIHSQEKQLILDQQMDREFDRIFVACGSGSTLAGLIVGYKLLEKEQGLGAPQIIGVLTSPTKPKSYHQERILRLARMTAELVGLNPTIDIRQEDIRLDDSSVGTGYGILDEQTASAVDIAAKSDSLLLDPVYTAKVMDSMLAWAKQESISVGHASRDGATPTNVLFIHTGGQNALSAYADAGNRSQVPVASPFHERCANNTVA